MRNTRLIGREGPVSHRYVEVMCSGLRKVPAARRARVVWQCSVEPLEGSTFRVLAQDALAWRETQVSIHSCLEPFYGPILVDQLSSSFLLQNHDSLHHLLE